MYSQYLPVYALIVMWQTCGYRFQKYRKQKKADKENADGMARRLDA